MSKVETRRLDNGLTLLVETLDRPAQATQILLPTGSAADPRGREGATHLLHDYVQRGAGAYTTRQLQEAFDSLGVRRGGGSSRDVVTFQIACQAVDWTLGIGLLADILRRPRLPDDQFEPVRQLAEQELASLDDHPAQKLMVELTRRYFPGPFGRPALGTEESLAQMSADALRDHWRRTYCPADAVIAVAGGLPADDVAARIDELFGDWVGEPAEAAPPETAAEPKYEHITQDTEQVHLGVVYDDVPPGSPERYHARMAVQVLSGGMGARLFTEVREKRGLCYSVSARGQAVKGHGYVLAYAGTTTERSSETLEVLMGELRRLPGSVEPAEVERARVQLLSNVIMSDESTLARCGRMTSDQYLLGHVRTFDEIREGIESITADSLNEHLEKHPPRGFTVATLGSGFDWPAGLEL